MFTYIFASFVGHRNFITFLLSPLQEKTININDNDVNLSYYIKLSKLDRRLRYDPIQNNDIDFGNTKLKSTSDSKFLGKFERLS